MTGKIRLGLVGAGAIAQAYVKAMENSDVAEWCGVADVRADAANAAAASMGCPAFTDHQSLWEKAKPSAVIICTPPSTHLDIAVFFLNRRVAVLCEKPLCIDSASARTMVDAAERNSALLSMATKFRYVEDIQRARSMIAAGDIGDLLLVENAFTSAVNMASRWNANPALSGGGVIIDNGTHSVDLLRYLAGPISEVLVVEGSRTQSSAVEDTAQIFVRTAEGIPGSIDLSWTLNKELDTFVKVFGTRGTILVGWRESRVRLFDKNEWTIFGKGYDKNIAFARQMENFLNAVKGVEAPITSTADAVADVEVIQAAYESLAKGTWVTVGAAGNERPSLRASA